jgi:hypothetical protein
MTHDSWRMSKDGLLMKQSSDETHKRVLAWHWLADDGRMARTAERVEAGAIYSLPDSERVAVCRRGLHGSERALDALEHAPGALVCRVEIWGNIDRLDLEDTKKLAGRHRRVLWMADATQALNEFACDVAETALVAERDAGREPDPRSWDAIVVKRRWITGDATRDELQVAWDTARASARAAASAATSAAAWAAAWDAAWATSSNAAWATAWDTAWAAAWAAALAAAWAAASDTAWTAAWAQWNELLTAKLLELAPDAAVHHEDERG